MFDNDQPSVGDVYGMGNTRTFHNETFIYKMLCGVYGTGNALTI